MKVRLSFSFFLFFFKTGFLCVALTVLELTLQTRLAFNPEIRLPLPPAGCLLYTPDAADHLIG